MAIYGPTNKIKFTAISERYKSPTKHKAKISKLHSTLISYVCNHYTNTAKYRQKVTDALNILTYCVMDNEVPPFDWTSESPLSTMPDIDMDMVANILRDIYLTPEAIEWDISATDIQSEVKVEPVQKPVVAESKPIVKKNPVDNIVVTQPEIKQQSTNQGTQKEDLYIKSPMYPRFDYDKPWISQQDGLDKLVIYTTLPEIPTKQNEISITTDVNMISNSELMKLYPTKLIRTRSPIMYEPVEGLNIDSELGLILPIEGYTESQLIDNIIRYPHIYQIKRIVGESIQSFYTHIEVNNELLPIEEIWDSLPESQVIPKQSEFIKEYVVRRYILESEAGVSHTYNMYGTLLPYLTLFMPSDMYCARGYTDVVGMARQCVESRVSFKRSRNPILRRLGICV